jgi:hypothetical protein
VVAEQADQGALRFLERSRSFTRRGLVSGSAGMSERLGPIAQPGECSYEGEIAAIGAHPRITEAERAAKAITNCYSGTHGPLVPVISVR